jgi:hypothetical protein
MTFSPAPASFACIALATTFASRIASACDTKEKSPST